MTTRGEQRLYMLSFDHRGSFKKGLMGIAGEPTEAVEQVYARAADPAPTGRGVR